MLLGSNGFAATPGRSDRWRSVDRRNVKEARFEPRSGAAYSGVRNHGVGGRPADCRAVAVHLHQGQDRQDSARPGHHARRRRNRYGVRPRVAQHRPVRDRPQCPGRTARADQRGGAVERRGRHPAGRQFAAPHRQAAGQRPVAGARRHRHCQPRDRDRGLQRKQPGRRGAEAARHRRHPAADQHRPATRRAGLPIPVRHRKAHLSRFRPDRAEGVRRQLRRRGRRQRADHLQVQPERRLSTPTASWSSRSSTRRSTTTTPTARSPPGQRCGVFPAIRTNRSP